MTPPVSRPIPRFVAEPPQEALPYGRWAETLAEHFARACGEIDELPEEALPPQDVTWFQDRGWNGRIYVPASARSPHEGEPIEYFGYVSFVLPEGGEPGDFRAAADFTDVTSELNPGWEIDLNDEVVGGWKGEPGLAVAGDVTLVWGQPLVPGAVAATAELDGEVLDQCVVESGRFSLVAMDAVKGYGPDLYVRVRLWNRRGEEVASESLYDLDEPAKGDEPAKSPDSSAG